MLLMRSASLKSPAYTFNPSYTLIWYDRALSYILLEKLKLQSFRIFQEQTSRRSDLCATDARPEQLAISQLIVRTRTECGNLSSSLSAWRATHCNNKKMTVLWRKKFVKVGQAKNPIRIIPVCCFAQRRQKKLEKNSSNQSDFRLITRKIRTIPV